MGSGNKPLKKNNDIVVPATLRCMCCNKELNSKEFYDSDSNFYKATGKVPYCRECLDNFYQDYLSRYKKLGYACPDKKAVERMCMVLDLYYSDKIFDSVQKKLANSINATLLQLYFKEVKLYQYRNKDYDSTIQDKYKVSKNDDVAMSIHTERDGKQSEDIEAAIKIFGSGFENEDYLYLYEQYCDWTARHECNTKAQEEVFKQICFTQLELLKATRAGSDTKDLTATFQKLLDTAKLQPKQNSGNTMADNQTFGTLIDKWENTRPIPEVDEELRDVDKIGLYIDTFFRGHLAKMMGLKNGLSNLYDKYMKRYTVEKPEYDSDEDNEILFDAIFGGSLAEDE